MKTSTRIDLERHLRELADQDGWRRHDRSGRTRAGYVDGFPHEVITRGGRLLFIFLLGDAGELIPPERHWLADLEDVQSVEPLVFRPDDLRAVTELLSADEERP